MGLGTSSSPRSQRASALLGRLAWAVLVGLLLTACGSPRPEVSVQVLTDLAPVTQFDEILIRRDGTARSFVVSNRQRYDEPRLVVEYTDVRPDTVLELSAELRFRGLTVLRRTRTTRVTGRHIVLFTFTASCTEIVCPMAEPRATECVGGRCVEPGCEGRECAAPECAVDADCAPSSRCEAPRCLDGVCFQFADPARCNVDEVCVPGTGCQLRLPDPDGGVPELPDAWAPDPPDAAGECIDGTSVPCETGCGTQGSAYCAGGVLGSCEPPGEICSGADEDCDGAIDEGFACRAGAAETCTTSCGSGGTRACSSGCAWDACVPASGEVCNGADEDCDGSVDEGYRSRYVFSTFTELSASHAGCNGTTERLGLDCNAAIHRYCRAAGCSTSGFGPIENDGDVANVACVIGDVEDVPFATLSGFHAPCDGTTERVGRNCNAAISRYCASRGYATGFGPVEHDGTRATVTCVRSAEVRLTSYGELSGFIGPCDGTTERAGLACNAAISRYCASVGFTSGFGPIENDGDVAYVACMRP